MLFTLLFEGRPNHTVFEEEGMKHIFQDPAGVKILPSDFKLTVWFRIDIYLAKSLFLQLLKGFSVSEPLLKTSKGPVAF